MALALPLLLVDPAGFRRSHQGAAERLAHIEQELDRVGKRQAAEQFLASLEASAEPTREHIETLRRGGYAA
jgi:hypothetical protein